MRRLEGKVALLSGTARGPGRAAALRSAAEGALVVGGDVLHDEAVETQLQIGREGGTALTPGPLDVTGPASVEAWVAAAAETFGGLDIVLTNAGSMRFGSPTEQPRADYATTVRSELDSVCLTARAAWPHLTLGRPGTPQDIARVAAFLASEEASSVSGAHLAVDGGWSAVPPGPLT
ncbi:SDR family NAD(P)-dependent oxidoreductase [Streptomyces zaomyceticus]|uniref:SDR family NAD(P)-dependent oxidoreductase n=1 Tax=Streptomyces zaomyceticus TaxID=68286 RepID=UPI003794113B